MSVAAPRVLAPATRLPAAPNARLGPAGALRALAFGGLGLWGALAWARLLVPASRPALLAMVALAAGLAVALGRVPQRRGWGVAAVAGGAIALLGVLALAGAPARTFAPAHWGELARGIGDGLGALPGATTPYRGADPWARTVLEAGGGMLLVLAGIASALLPPRSLVRDRALAALPLLAVAGVPAVVLPRQRVGEGVVLLVLLLAALGAEEVRRAEARAAAALVALAVVAGGLGGLALDGRAPWLPYQHLAESLVSGRLLTFDWDHTYGPLNWSRDGEEVLRVHMARPVYLKARDLDDFDGRGWTSTPVSEGFGPGVAAPPDRPAARGTETLRVAIRSLRTRDVVGAGALLSVRSSPVGVLGGSSPGTLVATRPLRRGDAYLVRVWAPNPTASELARPGVYPLWAPGFRTVRLPLGHITRDVTFPAFGTPAHPLTAGHGGISLDATAALERSPYGRTYRLARSLAAASSDPATFVARVRDRLRDGSLTYAENVPEHRWPLPAFLFADHRGYCQQFSGAMALILRMGGIPARVATGFTPGTRDATSGDWIVRDVNAHSWVEAWFPRWGWVTFDPTPPSAPARLGPAATNPQGGTARRGDVPLSGRRGVKLQAPRGGASWPLPVGGGAILALAGLAVVLQRRRRGWGTTPVEELAGALRACAAADLSGLTLVELERRLAGCEPASGYVRALREARYGGGVRPLPPDGRRALRAELARGGGATGTLRALRALPPRPRRRRIGARRGAGRSGTGVVGSSRL